MEWHHSQAIQKKKFKKSPSAGKVMINVIRRSNSCRYDAKREENSDASIKMLTEVNKHFQQVCPHKNPTETLLQHDNDRLPTSLETRKAITKFGWAVLPHPS